MSICIARRAGLAGYKVDRCRCDACRAAATEYGRRRARLIAYGRWETYVDAAPVREYIRDVLQPAGFGAARIAALSGLSQAVVNAIVWGRHGHIQRQVRAATAEAILAVEPDVASLASGQLVDAAGTRRRILALAAIGYSLTAQAKELGWTGANLRHLPNQSRVMVKTARAVAGLYERWSGTAAPNNHTTRRTRRWAQRRGGVSPLLWEGVDIDDPAARPEPDGTDEETPVVDEVAVQRAINGAAPFSSLTKPERAAAIRRLAAAGVTRTDTARRLRLSGATVNQYLGVAA